MKRKPITYQKFLKLKANYIKPEVRAYHKAARVCVRAQRAETIALDNLRQAKTRDAAMRYEKARERRIDAENKRDEAGRALDAAHRRFHVVFNGGELVENEL